MAPAVGNVKLVALLLAEPTCFQLFPNCFLAVLSQGRGLSRPLAMSWGRADYDCRQVSSGVLVGALRSPVAFSGTTTATFFFVLDS